MAPPISIWDEKGAFHLLRLMRCSGETAIKSELRRLIEIDQFWAELFDAFYNNGKKHVDDQYILGLKVWHRTRIAKLQHQTASDLIVCHMLREKTQRLLTIFDCGTGDGIMVLRFLKAMHVPDTSAIKVVLID